MSSQTSQIKVRSATPADISVLLELVKALAAYENLSHAVTGNADLLENHLFGPRRYAEALLAELDGQAAGFALFFYNYSTFLTKPGDLPGGLVCSAGISAARYCKIPPDSSGTAGSCRRLWAI